MEHQNEVWVEAAYETFEGAIEQGNYTLCEDIIADTKDAGFDSVAVRMTEMMHNAPIFNYIAHWAAQN